MKIGIGITTYRRPKTLKLSLKHFNRHTPMTDGVDFVYHIQTFYPAKHKSIAEVKNLCLKNLMQAGCDYLYLFDDDCFPIHDDWWKHFIEAHLRTNQHHLLYLSDDSKKLPYHLGRKQTGEHDVLTIFNNAQGCCLFLTRYAVLGVGGFDERFTGYGYEHEQYSIRIFRSGLNTVAPFMSVKDVEQYLWSLDIQGCEPYISQMGDEYDKNHGRPRSAISLQKMQASLARNKQVFETNTPILIPLNYE